MTSIDSSDFQRRLQEGSCNKTAVIETRENVSSTKKSKLQDLKNDEFVKDKQDRSCDGKFTFKEAAKNFGKGLIAPVAAIIKKPLLALGLVAATIAACSIIPVLTPIMTIAFGALSVFQLGKGIVTAASEYKKGNYDDSERAFQNIGTGFIGTLLTALGVKQSAKVAAEAKAMSKLGVTTLNAEQKAEIAAKISSGSWFKALKENFSLLTTKDGLKAVGNQFKPKMIAARLNDIKNLITNKRIEKKEKITRQERIDRIEEFKKSPEGIRRSKLSNAEVETEARALFDQAFDELGIKPELRPKLKIEEDVLRYMRKEDIEMKIGEIVDGYRLGGGRVKIFSDADNPIAMSPEDFSTKIRSAVEEHCKKTGKTLTDTQKRDLNYWLKEGRLSGSGKGGSYSGHKHSIELTASSYRDGIFEIDEVIMHEATHCKEALLRAGLPQDKADSLTRDILIDRIRNGESEHILKKGSIIGAETMEPPKMSTKMKGDFADFADSTLYTKDHTLRRDLVDYSDYRSFIKTSRTPEEAAKYQASFGEATQKLNPIIDKLKKMLRENPDFAAQYGSQEEALNALMDYSLSHNVRYNHFTDISVGGIRPANLPKLTDEQLLRAIKSFEDNITTTEGNARISGFRFYTSDKEFNQYQFSPEEVLAQQKGNKFLIDNLTARMEAMRKSGNLTPEHEAYLSSIIDKARHVIEYKTKGLEYYETYTRLLHNPTDAKLLESLKAMEEQLAALKKLMSPEEMHEVVEYVTRMVRPDSATVKLPLNVAQVLGVGE